MRTITKEKITLCFLLGLLVFAVGTPLMIGGTLEERTLEKYDNATPAYTPHAAILLDGNAEMIAQATAESWLGNGSEESPYQITGYSFYDTTHSIEIRNIDLHWEFTDNYIDGPYNTQVWCGMEIKNSTNGYVANNEITGRFRGLWLIDIYDITITNNFIHTNLFHAIECISFINGCLITDNILTGNEGSGIRILEAVDSEISGNNITASDGTGIQVAGKTNNCLITNNHIEAVTGLGIHLRKASSVEVIHNEIANISGDGICIQESYNTEVYNNTLLNGNNKGLVFNDSDFGLVHNNSIVGSDGIGILMSSGANMTFRFNHIEDSTEYGLKTETDTEYIEVTRNVFINNGVASQAYDEGANNTFIYNYYDDWVSPDADLNQIVDVPYAIDGNAENEDPYPLANPNAVPPIIEGTTTPADGDGQIPMEILLVAGAAVVIILVVVFFVKRKV